MSEPTTHESTPRPGTRPGRASATEAAALLEQPGPVLLDVREPYEWEAGHAPSAVHVPLGELAPDRIPTGSPVLVVCHVGGRSAQAAAVLAANGWQAVNVTGGMAAWAAAGLPVVTDDGTPGRIV